MQASFRDESNVTARRLAPDFGPHFAGTNFAEGGVASVEQGDEMSGQGCHHDQF
jgi:hypothetical protein